MAAQEKAKEMENTYIIPLGEGLPYPPTGETGEERKTREASLHCPNVQLEPASDKARQALQFEVHATWGRARASTLVLPHDQVKTPIFMPVGTQGTVKGLTPKMMEDLDCHIILGNTYHLALRPGGDELEEFGGLHKFMNWKRNILTDSGGFQMVSLSELCTISEEGVVFKNHIDESPITLTPERSIQIQNQIGADIIMALDDVVTALSDDRDRIQQAMERTIRWIDRCFSAHSRPHEQNLFPIVQGGLFPDLREICINELVKRDAPGYAIGGLSGGESKHLFWQIVKYSAERLPSNKPRYCMGVGFPVDLVVCTALGVDMYDCVYPTRTARFGTALVESGFLKLKSAEFESDYRPIEEGCDCPACKHYTRAYIHELIGKEASASILVTQHNIAYQLRLMRNMRNAIIDGTFPDFVRTFMLNQYPNKDYPKWVVDALREAYISLD